MDRYQITRNQVWVDVSYLLQIIRSLGCNKCLKDFPRDNKTNRSDYSGYDVENWTLRIGTEHKLFAEESLSFNTAVGKVNDAKLLQIDNRQKLMKIHTDVGRIAHSISKWHKSMKADEWKNWTLIYSMFCLRNILHDRDITDCSFFVKACMMLCKRSITVAEINQGHELLQCIAYSSKYFMVQIIASRICTSHYI